MKAALPLLLLLVACARPPRTPESLRAIDAALENGAQLATLAPTEMAAARADREAAAKAHEQGDSTSAELYAERGLARLQIAKLVSERAQLEVRLRDAEPSLLKTEQELAQIAQEQATLDSHIAELELRKKIAGDLEAKGTLSPAESAARKKARATVAASLSAEATLICGAARLLSSDPAPIDQALAQIPKEPDFERAAEAREACLRLMQVERRRERAGAAQGDALLEQLSKTERYSLARDERGVVISLAAAPRAEDLEALGRSARGHALQIVVHDATAADASKAQRRADDIKSALVGAGAEASKIAIELAGTALPIGDPNVAALRAQNARVEIVFVR